MLARLFDRITKEREELRKTARVMRQVGRGITRSQIPRMAAALAYRTIFTIVPVLVISAVVVNQFVGEEELRPQVERLLAYAGIDTITNDAGATAEPGEQESPVGTAAPEPGEAEIAESARDRVEPATAEATDSIGSVRTDDLVRQLLDQAANVPLRAIGILGVLLLAYASISMLVELEKSFNQIYRAPTGRAWSRRVAMYWTTLTLGTILLLGAFAVGGRIQALLPADEGVWGTILGLTVTLLVNLSLLLLAYTTVPNTRVRLRPALAGAAVAAVMWEAAKWAFTGYVGFAIGNFEQLYGAVAFLPLFLLWVYATWLIVLFGLQVAYALQHFDAWSAEDEAASDADNAAVDPMAALAVAAVVAGRFERAKTTGPRHAARAVGISESSAERVLTALAAVGVLRQTGTAADEPDRFTLADRRHTSELQSLTCLAYA
ncbi:MAG: YihY/virulence factor BrkB family protein, partial [Planctomycetota bacterium]